MYAYLYSSETDDKIKGTILKSAVHSAKIIAERFQTNGYHNAMLAKDYVWGSNSEILNYALMLLITEKLAPELPLRSAALESLNYIFGRNTFNISFVTQVGSKWPMFPHHRPSGADGIELPWPGLMVGGPNARGKENPGSHWADDVDDPSYNENAINWQAPLILVLAATLPE
jgi:endoglucanase